MSGESKPLVLDAHWPHDQDGMFRCCGAVLKQYTVVGVYADNDYQRFADCVEAEDPQQAEYLVVNSAVGELIVAGVFEGDITAVDAKT